MRDFFSSTLFFKSDSTIFYYFLKAIETLQDFLRFYFLSTTLRIVC